MGYMMIGTVVMLYSNKLWADPTNMGHYFQIPVIAITEAKQKTAAHKWKVNKNQDNFKIINTGLHALCKRINEESYPTGGTTSLGFARRGFGNDEPPDIIAQLQGLYGAPNL